MQCFAPPRNNLSLSGGFHQGLSSRKIRAKLSPEVTVTKEACVASKTFAYPRPLFRARWPPTEAREANCILNF